jgi:flagellar basal-body rod protein FlgB
VLASAGNHAGALLQTDKSHLGGTAPDRTTTATLRGEAAPDGNQVSLDQQLEKIAQTDSDHEAVTAIYRRYVAMFKEALGR